MNKNIVLYHADCSDGFGAAWSAWKKFKNKADYIPVYHQEPPPKGLKNKEIYLLDFTYFSNYLEKLIKENNVTTIDHHEGALESIKKASRYFFDNNHSGSVLSWKYFHPKKPIPWLLRYIEDRDLWKWKIPQSKQILKSIDFEIFDFENWNKLSQKLENKKNRINFAKEGGIMLKYEAYLVKKITKKAVMGKFENKKVWILNTSTLRDETADYLLKNKSLDIAIIWREEGEKRYISLRSKKSVDVSMLAKKYGGGGHKQASGFTFDTKKPLPWKYQF